MLQFHERKDVRRPAPESPVPPAKPEAVHALRLQRSAGNQAVVRMLAGTRRIQRTLLNSTTGGGMSPAGAATWSLLSPAQKAAVRRMQHDVYQQFAFQSPNHMFAHVISQIGPAPAGLLAAVNNLVAAAPAPVITQVATRRQHQGPHQALPPGVAPAAGNADPTFRAYTREGRARYTDPTNTPRSNWSHFAEAQLVAAERALPGPLGPNEQTTFTQLAAVARRAATELDAVHEMPPGAALTPALGTGVTDQARLQALIGAFAALIAQEAQAIVTAGPRATRMTEMTNASRDLEVALEGIWRLVLQAKQALNPAVGLARTSLPVPNLPRWGPVIGDGMGTWMHATFTPDGTWVAGSSSDTASHSMPWNVGRLNQRKKANWVGTLYVQGHLLNDHLGGPALAYNLVPLVSDGTSATNHANLSHFYLIENRAKSAVQEMLRARSFGAKAMKAGSPPSPSQETITGVDYSVVAEFSGHAYRAAARGRVHSAAAHVLNVRLQMLLAGRANPGAVTLDTLNTEARAGISGLNYARDWTPMKDAIDAVVPLAARSVTTLNELTARLQANDVLWAYEDSTVPTALHIALRTHRASGEVTPADVRIDNVLPMVATQPFVQG